MQITRTALQSAYIGFNAAFQAGLANTASQYAQVATTINSSTKSQEYGWLAKMPRIREWIGDRTVHALETEGYTIKNKKFEMTIEVGRDDFEDDNLGIYNPLFMEMGGQASTFPDELIWPLLAAGFATTCYDGQYFFDTDHPVLDENGVSQSVSNTGGGAGTAWYLLDVSRALKPLIFQQRKALSNIVRMDKDDDENVFMRDSYMYGLDGRSNVGFGFWQQAYGSKQTLNAANYEAARVAMHEFKGDYGKPLAIKPGLLVVPPALEGAANEILTSQLINGGDTNKWAGTAKPLVVPWLA